MLRGLQDAPGNAIAVNNEGVREDIIAPLVRKEPLMVLEGVLWMGGLNEIFPREGIRKGKGAVRGALYFLRLAVWGAEGAQLQLDALGDGLLGGGAAVFAGNPAKDGEARECEVLAAEVPLGDGHAGLGRAEYPPGGAFDFEDKGACFVDGDDVIPVGGAVGTEFSVAICGHEVDMHVLREV